MLKLAIVVATVLLNVVKSQPINVNVDVTVNGVKVPLTQDPPRATDLNHRSGILDPGIIDPGIDTTYPAYVSFGFLA